MEPEQMLIDGWCDDCDMDPAECILKGQCMGEVEGNDSD